MPNRMVRTETETHTDSVSDESNPTQEGARPRHFPIVGIGASAGGLAAFEAFFSGMPSGADPGMAFVLVQHLAPDHKSMLSDLISRYTRMSVFEVTDGIVVEPNSIYIIPPGRDMTYQNGSLQLQEPSAPRGQRLPIDYLFRSLANDLHERSMCIVLSGTGSDGSQGLKAIKGEGGLVMAQLPESAEYDGMPRNAINTGMVDYVLPPAEMPSALIAYVNRSFGNDPHRAVAPRQEIGEALKKVFELLRSQAGHDFSQYKQNTILRRIERRMAVQQIGSVADYVRFLQQTPGEIESLFRDLLIGVTNFFRDPHAFSELEELAIPALFEGKPSGSSVRVWVPGCSSGEEAYSIAILLQEHMEKIRKNFRLQVFATDIDARAIDSARAGLYPANVAADIPEERLARFFTSESDGSAYRINKIIRDILVFSEQDIIRDPPFSRLDMISCRNVMIYFGGELQKRLIPLFHYALNPGGVLFLGSSETPGEFTSMFQILDRQAKIFQRKEEFAPARRAQMAHLLPSYTGAAVASVASGVSVDSPDISMQATTERILAQRYAPISVMVNEAGDILYVHGNTGRFLEIASGEPGLNILKLSREGLRRELTVALHRAVKTGQVAEHRGVRVKTNGDYDTVDLVILPFLRRSDSTSGSTLYLVVFEERPRDQRDAAGGETPSAHEGSNFRGDAADTILRLQQELRSKEEYLKSAHEELETSNEELKSSNEEMQSINEELQSTNEELETSKEELQSVNEELTTVNTELQTKVFDLSRANNDMNNLLAGTGVGTIFVDFQLCIQRFTPSVTQVINLILSDVGRPVGHIVSNLVGYDSLVADIRSVLSDLMPKEVEVQTLEGAWFLLRIRPYRTLDNVIEGAVITFFEISEMKQARESLKKANDVLRLAVVVRDSRDAIILQDLEGRILAWNPAAARMYGWTESEALGLNIRQLIPADLVPAELERIHQLGIKPDIEPHRSRRITKDGGIKEVWLTASAMLAEDGTVYAVATTERAAGS